MAGTVSAKTDRLEGIVDFTEQQVRLLVLLTLSYMQHAVTGPLGKPQHLELQHKQADGLGHEDHPPHQQGGDGELV